LRRLIACSLVLLGAFRGAGAQSSDTKVEGALDFLLPTGARSLAMGQAAAASAVGSDALWWNPALIAHGPRELALHMAKNSSPLAETDAGGAFVLPVSRLGAVALSIRYVNYGQQNASSDNTGKVGTFSTTSTIFAATFAPTLTSRLSGGLTYKLLRIGFACTGQCEKPANAPQTPAVDVGFQYLATRDSSVSIGASIRNLGPKLQINDAPQADPLPGRADIGVAYRPRFPQLPREAQIQIAGDVVSYLTGGGSPGLRLGGEFAWMGRYQARAGYVHSGATGSGPTFGFGISTGKLQIDLAQFISDLSSQSGATPTFLSLRYIF
jgi:hypothetical protein